MVFFRARMGKILICQKFHKRESQTLKSKKDWVLPPETKSSLFSAGW